ncbi:MAG: alpha/beta hydrolase [Verrucomicrobia bacterium]|nr:alpha/beta hydrolase [Verrucomicrobiota bacterium]
MRFALLALSLLSTMPAMSSEEQIESLQIRIHGDASKPTLIYLPGLHGDWTLVSSFRHEISEHVRFVEFTYPRTLTWSLEEYADAVESALLANGITEGWLLAESFGSQVAWSLARNANAGEHFKITGIILAGGFVKHPNAPGIFVVKQILQKLPNAAFRNCLRIYAKYATVRHRQAPETLAIISETVARRTELDRQAMTHRLNLLAKSELQSIACKTDLPVFALSGFWDPIVPRVLTQHWLKKNCPGFRDAKVIFRADHNVLGTAPVKAVEAILDWIITPDT